MNRPDLPREPSRLSGHLQKAEGAAAAFRLPPPIGQGIEHDPVSGDAGHVVTARHRHANGCHHARHLHGRWTAPLV